MQHGIIVIVGVDSERCYTLLHSPLLHLPHEKRRHTVPLRFLRYSKAMQHHVWSVAQPATSRNFIICRLAANKDCTVGHDCTTHAQHIPAPSTNIGLDVALRRIFASPLPFAIGKHSVAGLNDNRHYVGNVGHCGLPENKFRHVPHLLHIDNLVVPIAKAYFLRMCKAGLILGIGVGVVEVVVMVMEIGMAHLVGKLAAR